MKFLVDQQLPRRLVTFIRAKGFEAQHVKDFALEQATDRHIWREAQRRGFIVVSKDEDFSLIKPTTDCPQIVWIRLGNCSNNRLLQRFEDVWDQLAAELRNGAKLVELR